MFLMAFISVIIPSTLLVLNFLLSKSEPPEREKPSSFECGFDPMCSARVPFSMQFFLITVIFLIFDVEITLILPVAQSTNIVNSPLIPLTLVLFLILIAGLYLEWSQGALEWYY